VVVVVEDTADIVAVVEEVAEEILVQAQAQ
jgi:hypothetical protein